MNQRNRKTQQCTMLHGSWSMESADGEIKCPIKIPGSVLGAAVRHGIIQDPYYRMNEYSARDFLKQDFIFSTKFGFEKQDDFVYELCCDGIDTVADIYLNGILLKHAENMHLRYRIPCGSALKNGENELKFYFHSAIRCMQAHIPAPGKEIHFTACGAMEGNQYIRKAHSMSGWDWGPQLPDMGIWRDIYIRGFVKASLEDVKIHQKHKENYVEITAEAYVKLAEPKRQLAEVQGSSAHRLPEKMAVKTDEECRLSYEEAKEIMPQLQIKRKLITPKGESIDFLNGACRVTDPQLWWPNRYGEQPLYTLKVSLYWEEELLNEKQYRIGLRTLTVSQEKDAWGEEFAFCINGVKIFAKGANYIPEDCIYERITPERIRGLLEPAVKTGFNCIRVWGGGYYPSDMFYDYCDEKGLIVWQDFMYACNVYELTDEFKEQVMAETRDNVRRLRHHASLGIWCGNNEMESAWDHWEGFCDHSKELRQDYLEMFESVIPKVLRSEDDVTFYWPSSPSSGGGFQEPDSDNIGDRHYWDVWHGEKPFSDYANYYFRFCSEFGFQSFPCMKTIQTFTLPKDRNIFSQVMESHQKNGAANGKILHYISDNFLYPKDFESLIYISQILQGIAVKEGVEHWRRNRGRCMGAVYWQLNDNWPVASWSGIDYFGRWKALQYMAGHFYADILGSLQVCEGSVYTPYIQNETLKDSSTEWCLLVRDMEGTLLYEKSGKAACQALSVTALEKVCLKEVIAGRESSVFVEAVFRHSDTGISHQVSMPRPYKHMEIKKAEISCSCSREEDMINVTLQSTCPAFFVEVQTEEDIVWSDNYMHLTDGLEYRITGRLPKGYEGVPEVRVRSLCDSYEIC